MRYGMLSAVLVAAMSASAGLVADGEDQVRADRSRLTIVAFGDSLTAGPGLRLPDTYPAVLQRTLREAGFEHRVVNAGVSGETTTQGLRRFERALTPDTGVVVLALGANDGFRGVSVDLVRKNLADMIALAQARGIVVVLCGMETPPLFGVRYSLDFHHVFPSLAAEYRVPLVPFLLQGVVGRAELNLGDGIHPNASGAALVAANVWPHLRPVLGAARHPA